MRAGKLTRNKIQRQCGYWQSGGSGAAVLRRGCDEIVFYDITASSDKRDIMIDVVKRVAETIFIPFSVGGGIRNLEDMRKVIAAGAEKVRQFRGGGKSANHH